MPRFSRKFVAVCVYMPPGMSSASAQSCLGFLVDGLLEIKRRYQDPFIALSGDFNQYKIIEALKDYPDLVLLQTPPTRGGKTLDLLFTNFPSQINASDLIPPLESDLPNRAPSDHKVIHCEVHLKCFEDSGQSGASL